MQQSPSWEANQFSASQKFPAFYGTRRFITAFTSAHHLSLSLASSIQSITPNSTFWRSILLLSSHLRLDLPSGLFPSGFDTKTLYTPLISPIRATGPTHPRTTLFAIMIMLQIGRSLRPVRVTLWHECKANTVNSGRMLQKYFFRKLALRPTMLTANCVYIPPTNRRLQKRMRNISQSVTSCCYPPWKLSRCSLSLSLTTPYLKCFMFSVCKEQQHCLSLPPIAVLSCLPKPNTRTAPDTPTPLNGPSPGLPCIFTVQRYF